MSGGWATEAVKLLQPVLSAIVGGGLVILAGWVADRRKVENEFAAVRRQEAAALTGMFAVRNHIATRLEEYEADGRLSRLEPLRTAQSYVHRLIERAPPESEGLALVVVEIGLKLDALLDTIDRQRENPRLTEIEWSKVIGQETAELVGALEQFDIISQSQLSYLTEEDLARMGWVEAGDEARAADVPRS